MHGRSYDPGMGPFPAPDAAGFQTPANQQSSNGNVLSTPYGAVSSQEITALPPVRRSCRWLKGCLIQGWACIIPGCHRLHEPPGSINNHSQCGWGFHTVRGGTEPGDRRFRFSSPFRWSCACIMEGFLIRGFGRIIAGYRRLHEPQPISSQPMRLGFPHPAGRYRPRGSSFSSWFVGVVDEEKYL